MMHTEKLTLFHVEGNQLTRHTLTGHWYETNAVTMAANGSLQPQHVVKVRIPAPDCEGFTPAKVYTGAGWTAKPGDYIVRGAVTYEVTAEKGHRVADLPQHFPAVAVVREARDRRVGVQPHIYIEGA